MKSSYIIAILATAQAALASPHILTSRDEHSGIRCNTPRKCVNWYNTGAAQCSKGYKGYPYDAPGYPGGTYCEKACTEEERTACTADRCKYNEKECNMYPKSAKGCANAMQWCDGPIATLPTICTSKNMGRTVTYTTDEFLCIPEGKSADSRKALPLRLGPGDNFNAAIYDPSVDGYVKMDCRGSDYSNAKSLAEKAAKVTEGCTTIGYDDEGNTGYGYLNIKCQSPKKEWPNVKRVLSQACSEAKSFNGNKVYFQTLNFSGQPK
jgi:hypothetical protein